MFLILIVGSLVPFSVTSLVHHTSPIKNVGTAYAVSLLINQSFLIFEIAKTPITSNFTRNINAHLDNVVYLKALNINVIILRILT